MSLYITAIAKAIFMAREYDEELHDTLKYKHICTYNNNFIERLDGNPEGIYTFEGKPVNFCAGEYSKYNEWRKMLSLTMCGVLPNIVWENFDSYEGKPFAELIKMSDAYGAIGSKTSKKLANDFETFKNFIEQRFRPFIVNNDESDWSYYFLDRYKKWHEAFKVASDDGFVSFG